MDQFIKISSGHASARLCRPDCAGGYYRGTRFDHCGVFRSIEYKGIVFSDEWFPAYDPYKHDCVTGPVEEFTQNGYESTAPGGLFMKPGVGLLRREDGSPYDWFHRYEIVNAGERAITLGDSSVEFRQMLTDGRRGYDYLKTVALSETGDEMVLTHVMRNTGRIPISGYVYDHNFFTLGGITVGSLTEIDFPFRPAGDWRAVYDSVVLTDNGVRFSRDLKDGEVVYMGNLRPEKDTGTEGYSFRICNGLNGAAVEVSGDARMDHAVFWAIRRVACVEPYCPVDIPPGGEFRWTIRYRFYV